MALDIKICGLKTPEAVAAALDGGATHIGFIFFPKSPRHITPDAAARLRAAATGRAVAVAVTVDADDEALDEIVKTVRPDMLQLHGGETPERVRFLKERYNLPVMKAFSIREAGDLEAIAPIGALPIASFSTPSRPRVPNFQAATAYPSTGTCWPRLTRISITCFPVD